MQMKRIAGWGQFEERVFGGPMCLRPHMLLCPDSWGWLVITRPDRQSVWCFLTHWLSEAYLRFLQASGPGSCVFDRSLFRISSSLAGRAWPGLDVQARVFSKGYRVFDLNSALVHQLPFFYLRVLLHAQKQPLILKLTPRLSPPQVGWLLQSPP